MRTPSRGHPEKPPAPKPPTIIIHAGAHKTGTTTIQMMFHQHPEWFPKIHYPQTGRIEHAHHNLAWELNELEWFDPAKGTLDDLVAELRDVRARYVLLSSEEFEYAYRVPERLAALRGRFAAAGYRTHCVILLRERCSYLESLYAELLKHGYRTSFDAFVDEAVRSGGISYGSWDFRIDYRQLIAGFVGGLGHSAVHAAAYDPLDSTRTFLDSCGRILGVRLEAPQEWDRYNVRGAYDYSGLPLRPSALSSRQRATIETTFGSQLVPDPVQKLLRWPRSGRRPTVVPDSPA